MKTAIFLTLLCLPLVAHSQYTTKICTDSSYSVGDTTAWFSITDFNEYILKFYFKDSANVSIAVQFNGSGAPATVFQSYSLEADSTNSVVPTGYWKGYILRGETDNIPGAEKFRIIVTKKSTKNGVSSPRYDCYLTRY